MGAQVLFYPTAIGWHPSEQKEWGAAQIDAWRTMQRSHAIANGVYVASPNRIGHEDEPGTDGITFFGHSFIADPFGRYLAEAKEEEAILVARCDPALIEDVRRNWPFLRDRRIDAYGSILERYLAG
jgi:N-carbamoylputrescine amidase